MSFPDCTFLWNASTTSLEAIVTVFVVFCCVDPQGEKEYKSALQSDILCSMTIKEGWFGQWSLTVELQDIASTFDHFRQHSE